MPRDRGQSRDGLAVLGCPALGSAGQSASELGALHPVAYVLEDLLTVASRVVHTHGLLANSRRNRPVIGRPRVAQLDPSAPEPKYLRVPEEETTHGPWV